MTQNRIATRPVFAAWRMALILTAVTCLSAQLSARLPFTPVPITMQVFAVLLSGLLLGRRFGALAQVQYLALGAAGMPVFALGHAGPGTLFGITGGYLLSYPVAAFAVGWIAERNTQPKNSGLWFAWQSLACAIGLTIIYGTGCSWLAVLSRPMLSPMMAMIAGAGWFVFWDIFKAGLAIAITSGLPSRGR